MHIANPIGKKGEDEAVAFLKKKKYKILERNYRKHYAEIDIIAIDTAKPEPVLVFIEVKTRTSNKFGTPFESITSWKLKPLLRAAQTYAMSHPKLPQSLRIDAIAVILDIELKLASLEHMENISDF